MTETEFNQALADIYKVIHPINAKNIFVTYLNKDEKVLLEKSDLLTLKLCVQKLKKLLDWKKQQILGLVTKANKDRISTFIDEIKKDSRTMMIIKKAICSEIIKKLNTEFSEEELKINPIYAKYNQYLQKLNWIFQGENKIIDYIVRSLKKGKGFVEKKAQLDKIKPSILSKIHDQELQLYANQIFSNWEKYYTFMLDRSLPADTHAAPLVTHAQEVAAVPEKPEEALPALQDDGLFLVDNQESVFLHEDEEAALLTDKQEAALNLPGFDDEDEAFINKLAELENANQIVDEINTLSEEKQEQIITEVSFDPRFDTFFDEIINQKGDIGEFLGSLTKKVKEIEKKYGYTASEDYLNDLIIRIKAEKGANHLLVKKIRNCLNNLMTIHERSALKLKALKVQLAGKDIIEQVKILQEKAKDKSFKGVFGTVRNLERIALETHFDDIFNNLSVELQKVIADGFMSDLKELKEYYPDLLKKLENKVNHVEDRLTTSYVDTHDVDYALIDKILGSLPGDETDSMEDLAKLTAEIMGAEGGNTDYRDLGMLMAGDRKYTSSELITSLEKQNTNENSKIDQIIEIMGEIEKLPDLNAKINTVRFWLEKKFYHEQPEIVTFLEGQLEALEERKIREGGLLRKIFDKLDTLSTQEEKTNFLKAMLKDPEYIHLKSIIQNLIMNVKTDLKKQKGHISEEFILEEIEKLSRLEDKIDWLKIRKALPVFVPFIGFINQTIKALEDKASEAVMEKLEDNLTKQQAQDKAEEKKAKGIKVVVHENIIALTRAVLKLDNKLERRKYILEQESVNPLAENHPFQKQRRLLFYLLNVEPQEKPLAMVKSLAEKMLLSREEKIEYFTLLKLTRFKSGDKIISLQEELGISDDDLAYYAADILACEKATPERKLDYFEKLRDGKIRLEEITIPGKDNEVVRKKYMEFFAIPFHTINKLMVYYKKLVKPRKAGTAADELPGEFKGEQPVEEQARESASPAETLPDNKEGVFADISGEVLPEIEPKVKPETKHKDVPAAENIPGEETAEEAAAGILSGTLTEELLPGGEYGERYDALSDKIDELPGERDELSVHGKTTREKSASSIHEDIPDEELPDTEPAQKKGQEKKIEEAGAVSEEDARPVIDLTKPDTDEYKIYMKNKRKIDEQVKKQLEQKAREKAREVEERIKEEVLKAEKEFKRNTGSKIQSIIRNLNVCQPEIISELINHTIIPLLTEANDTDTLDLITVLNQNLFTPILYSGASLEIKSVVQNIESFLHVDGIFKDCFKDLTEVVEKLKTVRGKYLNTVVESEMHQLAALNTAAKSGDLGKILKNLLKTEPAIQIINELEVHYLKPLAEKPDQKKLMSKLEFIKELIITGKKIEWGKGDTFPEETKQLLLKVRVRYQEAMQSSSGVQTIDGATGKKLGPVEKELINAKIFTNPLLLIKTVCKEHKIAMSTEAQAEVVRKLAGEGKIFSFDSKLYIGFGKLNEYLNDKNNIGYSKNKLAGELLKFLGRWQTPKDKAAFIGIPEDQYDEFIKKIEYWSTHNDAATTETKQRDPKKTAMLLKKKTEASGQEKKEAGQGRTLSRKQPKSKKTLQKTRKTKEKAAAPKGAQNKELLNKLKKMITDKLLFLIKESGSKDMLSMLYKSYLDPKAKKSNLFMLIDKDKYQTLYDSIKEDKALHERLGFDADLVKKAYNKKIAKVKK